jgi:hypothetical protein
MAGILSETEERFRGKRSLGGTASPFFFRPILGKPDSREKLTIKFGCLADIPDSKINMTERISAHVITFKTSL